MVDARSVAMLEEPMTILDGHSLFWQFATLAVIGACVLIIVGAALALALTLCRAADDEYDDAIEDDITGRMQ